jgi:hypothetical protein
MEWVARGIEFIVLSFGDVDTDLIGIGYFLSYQDCAMIVVPFQDFHRFQIEIDVVAGFFVLGFHVAGCWLNLVTGCRLPVTG